MRKWGLPWRNEVKLSRWETENKRQRNIKWKQNTGEQKLFKKKWTLWLESRMAEQRYWMMTVNFCLVEMFDQWKRVNDFKEMQHKYTDYRISTQTYLPITYLCLQPTKASVIHDGALISIYNPHTSYHLRLTLLQTSDLYPTHQDVCFLSICNLSTFF